MLDLLKRLIKAFNDMTCKSLGAHLDGEIISKPDQYADHIREFGGVLLRCKFCCRTYVFKANRRGNSYQDLAEEDVPCQ